jgi:hypothetical protein
MAACLLLATTAVTVVAAVRSTWSPCGLSMLSTITPFGERGKGHTYPVTVTWFVAGATMGGATLGALMAALAVGVGSLHLSAEVTGCLALSAALVAAGSDSGIAGVRLPFHRRQVNERWLDRYRPWVYGAGFGWQIGCGLATYITSAAVYLTIVLAALTADPSVALAAGIGFGLLRGLAVLLTRRLTDPSGLLAFHRRFFELGTRMGRLVVAAEVATAATIALWLHTVPGAVVVGLAASVGVTTALVAARVGRSAAPTCTVPGAGSPADSSARPGDAPFVPSEVVGAG